MEQNNRYNLRKQERCVIASEDCMKQMKLVALQIKYIDTELLFNLSKQDIKQFCLKHSEFYEVLRSFHVSPLNLFHFSIILDQDLSYINNYPF